MSMLRLIRAAGLLFVFALLATSCSKKPEPPTSGEKTLYTCSMHPQIIREEPGNCPICGMALQPLRKQSSANPLRCPRPPA